MIQEEDCLPTSDILPGEKVWHTRTWIWLYQTSLKENQFLKNWSVCLYQWILLWLHVLNNCEAKCADSELFSHDLTTGSSYAVFIAFPPRLTF